MKKYPAHALAKIFPAMESAAFKELVADVKRNGLLQSIILFQERVLDGVHRQEACFEADVEPRYEKFFGDDPIGYVLSMNLKRRHLSESQRAMVAAKIAALPKGYHASMEASSIKQVARLLKASRTSIERAHTIQKHGTPELIAAVEADQIAVRPAAEIAKLPANEQNSMLSKRKMPRRKSAGKTRSVTVTKLNSLAWSQATPAERTKFVSDVGLASIWNAADDNQRNALEKAIDAETGGFAVLA